VLAVSRFTSAAPPAEVAELAAALLATWAQRPGFRGGELAHGLDDDTSWVLLTRWDGVGHYRRALSAADARVAAHALLAHARAEEGAFAVVLRRGEGPARTGAP